MVALIRGISPLKRIQHYEFCVGDLSEICTTTNETSCKNWSPELPRSPPGAHRRNFHDISRISWFSGRPGLPKAPQATLAHQVRPELQKFTPGAHEEPFRCVGTSDLWLRRSSQPLVKSKQPTFGWLEALVMQSDPLDWSASSTKIQPKRSASSTRP